MRQGNARIGSCKVGFVLAALAFAAYARTYPMQDNYRAA